MVLVVLAISCCQLHGEGGGGPIGGRKGWSRTTGALAHDASRTPARSAAIGTGLLGLPQGPTAWTADRSRGDLGAGSGRADPRSLRAAALSPNTPTPSTRRPRWLSPRGLLRVHSRFPLGVTGSLSGSTARSARRAVSRNDYSERLHRRRYHWATPSLGLLEYWFEPRRSPGFTRDRSMKACTSERRTRRGQPVAGKSPRATRP